MPEKFIDGTPVPAGYQEAITQALNDCCDAEEMFDIDDLERYAKDKRKAKEDARRDLETSRESGESTAPTWMSMTCCSRKQD